MEANAKPCELQELISIQETKTYTNFANPILRALITAVQHKTLSANAFLIWVKLKMDANFHPELATKATVREIANQLGINKETAHKALKQLEEGGYIQIKKTYASLKNLPSTILVRFPQAGIELAKLEKDRALPNSLSTKGVEKSVHKRTENPDDIKNNNKQILKTNTSTAFSTQSGAEEGDNVTVTDCCLPSATEGEGSEPQFETDPVIEAFKRTQAKLEFHNEEAKNFHEAYQKNPGNLDTYHKLTFHRNQAKILEANLETLGQKKRKKVVKSCKAPGKSKFIKRSVPIDIPQGIENHIDRKLKEMTKTHGISGIETYSARMKQQLSHFEFGDSLLHAANICLSVLKKGRDFKIPGGMGA